MTKIRFIYFVLILLFISCFIVSCVSQNYKSDSADDSSLYDLKLYMVSAESTVNSTLRRYDGEELLTSETRVKENIGKKSMEILGCNYDFNYKGTLCYNLSKHGFDNYTCETDNGFAGILVDDSTGLLVRFDIYSTDKSKEYIADITEKSNKNDYIEYASSVLAKCLGLSVQDWDAEIKTLIFDTSYMYGADEIQNDFIKFTEKDPDFTAEYQISFYKKISNIRRADNVFVKMTDKGEITAFCGILYDEAYEPFTDVKIDTDEITRIVEKEFERTEIDHKVISHDISLCVIPHDDALFVESTVNYRYKEKDGTIVCDGIKYISDVTTVIE